ncbi:MAG: ABC transporter substrate-binding protein [Acidimicrobiales bacterium]|nr:ABC transporter substrate-binding protein [Acidimicrobiales bacterium]MCB9392169.1 ABC transporter substrate-binding protein [Acidimicrobiaceae bacterium]
MKRYVATAALAGIMGVTSIAVAGGAGAQDDTVTMTIGLLQDMSSPNVTVGYLVPEFEVWNLQYASLTDKAADDFAPLPGLAESWEESDGGLTYTYTLREGLKWSDGEPLTADDIAYTINRSRDEEWANHFSTVENIEATVLDDRTVQLTSSEPDPKLPTMDVYIVPQHVYEGIDAEAIADYDGMDGVASGQYSLVEWNSGQDWTLERNPNWFGRDNGIDRIVYRVFSNADALVAALQKGEIDAAHGFGAEGAQLLEQEDGIEVVVGLQGGFTELALNGMEGGIGDGHPALQDIDVRHAIYHAIDRQAIFDGVSLGYGSIGTTLSPSADTSWIPDLGDEGFEYDPAKATQLLDEAGYLDTDGDGVREMPDGGQPLRFRYVERSESENADSIRAFVTEYLDAVGIATDVEVMDDTQLYEAQVAGEYDIFVWGWTPYVDPDPMLSYFTCGQVTTDVEAAGYNDANWCSEEYDALYDQQKVELDPTARRAIVADMLRLFNRESTYLVLLQDADLQAYRTDRFEGWLRQPAETGPVIFSNSSPTYANLTVIDGGGDDGGMSTGLLIALIAGGVVVVGAAGFVVMNRSKRTADERE